MPEQGTGPVIRRALSWRPPGGLGVEQALIVAAVQLDERCDRPRWNAVAFRAGQVDWALTCLLRINQQGSAVVLSLSEVVLHRPLTGIQPTPRVKSAVAPGRYLSLALGTAHGGGFRDRFRRIH